MLFSPWRLVVVVILTLIGFMPRESWAVVANVSAGGFSIKESLEISAPSQQVYEAIINIGSWWSSSHTYSGNSKNLSIEATPGGCFCERWNGKASVLHMTVVNVEPGKRLRLSGGLGPLQDMGVAGSLTFNLAQTGGKTKLELTYNVGGYNPEGWNKLAAGVDSVLLDQITRLRSYIETENADPK